MERGTQWGGIRKEPGTELFSLKERLLSKSTVKRGGHVRPWRMLYGSVSAVASIAASRAGGASGFLLLPIVGLFSCLSCVSKPHERMWWLWSSPSVKLDWGVGDPWIYRAQQPITQLTHGPGSLQTGRGDNRYMYSLAQGGCGTKQASLGFSLARFSSTITLLINIPEQHTSDWMENRGPSKST